MKQTAVEWYENEINALFDKYENKEISESEFLIMKHNLFYPAKEMEMHQILNTYIEASPRLGDIIKEASERYYNETFNANER
jgi:hypothetical protein